MAGDFYFRVFASPELADTLRVIDIAILFDRGIDVGVEL